MADCASAIMSLYIGGELIGQCDGFTQQEEDMSDIVKRQCLWNTVAHIDRKYPAVVYTYEFDIVHTAASRLEAFDAYNALDDYKTGEKKYLTLTWLDDSGTAVGIDFGYCLMENKELVEPEKFPLFPAWRAILRWVGTTRPEIL
jgi:hypothetical protein